MERAITRYIFHTDLYWDASLKESFNLDIHYQTTINHIEVTLSWFVFKQVDMKRFVLSKSVCLFLISFRLVCRLFRDLFLQGYAMVEKKVANDLRTAAILASRRHMSTRSEPSDISDTLKATHNDVSITGWPFRFFVANIALRRLRRHFRR